MTYQGQGTSPLRDLAAKLSDVASGHPAFPQAAAFMDHVRTHLSAMAYAEENATRLAEVEQVCTEAYQVVGSLLTDVGEFDSERGTKILDNLSEAKMVHADILPWPRFVPDTSDIPEAGEDFFMSSKLRTPSDPM